MAVEVKSTGKVLYSRIPWQPKSLKGYLVKIIQSYFMIDITDLEFSG